MPSLISPKNGGSGTGSGIEEMEVVIDSDDRGERRGDSIELRGVGVRLDPLESVLRGRMRGCDGEEDRLSVDEIVGEDAGEICFGDCVGVDGRDGFCPSSPKMPGSLCPKGRIALNMCVTIVAPALSASCACSNVASEWPVE